MLKKVKELTKNIYHGLNYNAYDILIRSRFILQQLLGKDVERKKYFERIKHNGPNRLLTTFLSEGYELSNIHNVVEIGVGTGNDTLEMLNKGRNVEGIDQTIESNYYVKSKYIGKNFNFKKQNFERLDIGENIYDLCYSHSTLSFCKSFNELKDVISKINMSLKSGGYLVINVFGKEEKKLSGSLLFSLDEVNSLLSENRNIILLNENKNFHLNGLKSHQIYCIATKI